MAITHVWIEESCIGCGCSSSVPPATVLITRHSYGWKINEGRSWSGKMRAHRGSDDSSSHPQYFEQLTSDADSL